MSRVRPRRGRRKKEFRIDHIRRREIEAHARYVGAADTEDFERWLVAWVWHNRQSTDPIWAVANAARRMGRPNMSDAEASAITEEASITRKHLLADNLAKVGVEGSNPFARSNIVNNFAEFQSGVTRLPSAECPRNLFGGCSQRHFGLLQETPSPHDRGGEP